MQKYAFRLRNGKKYAILNNFYIIYRCILHSASLPTFALFMLQKWIQNTEYSFLKSENECALSCKE